MHHDHAANPADPAAFDHQPRTRLIFGAGSVQRIAELTWQLGGTRILLVTDPGIVAAGHAQRVQHLLEDASLAVTRFEQVEENPTTHCVDQCLAVARAANINLIIGLGGGSSMDTAKGCNFLLTNGGQMEDYWGVGKARLPMLPLIAIPTTGGTGSECQSFALISRADSHQKMACGDPKAAAAIAILDPELTLSQPPRVTACSGIDAVAHSVESAVTTKRTPLSKVYSREAFRLTMRGLPRVLSRPDDLEARGFMQLGAAFAGLAIENSMLGAAHSAANPLTAHFNIAHGQAVGLMLPHVVRFNARAATAAEEYAHLAHLAKLPPTDSQEAPSDTLARALESLLAQARLASPLGALGVTPEALSELSREAAGQWTARFNPASITAEDFAALYTAAGAPSSGVPQKR
jgi:alcohol dehydrogenase